MHFRTRRNWLSDPNGLVVHRGRHHLFFQHNPDGVEHREMSWGHASSADLVHWEEHPVAIRATPQIQIYSGSAVVDHANASGLGTADSPALVAVFTASARDRAHQAQALAYSTDEGLTWRLYEGNPVLDRGSSDFRDPKVFRYEGPAGSYWVMVAVEAHERRVVLYRSDDLLAWTYLSSYGPRGAVGGVWECPDLFPLAVDGAADDVRWVLLISLCPGGIAGGSGTQYVVGDFDGVTFTPDDPPPVGDPRLAPSRELLEHLDWLDHGPDCYAGVTFWGLADADRTLIAWMSNWDYARELPVSEAAPQRGRMTLPRRLALTRHAGRPVLRQEVAAPPTIPVARHRVRGLTAPGTVTTDLPASGRLDVRLELEAGTSCSLVLGADGSDGADGIVLTYDAAASRVRVERTLPAPPAAGGEIPASFAGAWTMPLDGGPAQSWTLWLDDGTLELFADDGTRVLTCLTGHEAASSLRCEPGPGAVVSLEAVVSTFAEL